MQDDEEGTDGAWDTKELPRASPRASPRAFRQPNYSLGDFRRSVKLDYSINANKRERNGGPVCPVIREKIFTRRNAIVPRNNA